MDLGAMETDDLRIPGMNREQYIVIAQILVACNETDALVKDEDKPQFAQGILDGLNVSLRQSELERAELSEIYPPNESTIAFAKTLRPH